MLCRDKHGTHQSTLHNSACSSLQLLRTVVSMDEASWSLSSSCRHEILLQVVDFLSFPPALDKFMAPGARITRRAGQLGIIKRFRVLIQCSHLQSERV